MVERQFRYRVTLRDPNLRDFLAQRQDGRDLRGQGTPEEIVDDLTHELSGVVLDHEALLATLNRFDAPPQEPLAISDELQLELAEP
jgi:hypothetical protein